MIWLPTIIIVEFIILVKHCRQCYLWLKVVFYRHTRCHYKITKRRVFADRQPESANVNVIRVCNVKIRINDILYARYLIFFNSIVFKFSKLITKFRTFRPIATATYCFHSSLLFAASSACFLRSSNFKSSCILFGPICPIIFLLTFKHVRSNFLFSRIHFNVPQMLVSS